MTSFGFLFRRERKKCTKACELHLFQYHLEENYTFSLLKWACSCVTVSDSVERSVSLVRWLHYSRASVLQQGSDGVVQFLATWCPFQPRDLTPTHPLLPLSSSLPTKWMTAFSNTRVRHDSEVHMLCHLCPTCFDASAEKDHACSSTSSQLMLQPHAISKLPGW